MLHKTAFLFDNWQYFFIWQALPSTMSGFIIFKKVEGNNVIINFRASDMTVNETCHIKYLQTVH